jgi:hypothetical protein
MRLPVILVQNPPASGVGLADDLVGNLIGKPGLDLTLVDRLDAIAADSTDHLTLEGITVPSAVLDWRSPEEMIQQLASIGFHGRRCPHQLDAEVRDEPSQHVRRLFLFDLTVHTHADAIIAELSRLRESLSVKIVSLGASLSPGPSRGQASAAAMPPASASDPGGEAAASRSSKQTAGPPPKPSTDAETANVRPMIDRTSDEELDGLIDQLDELDSL